MQVVQKLAKSTNYSRGRSGKHIDYIFIHYTGSTAPAKNNVAYFARDKTSASAHYFLDGTGTIYQSVADADTAWSVGNFDINQRSISIEVASAGADFTDAEKQELRWLVPTLMRRYGISASHVFRHYDAVDVARTGRTLDPHKHCPAPYIDKHKWLALRDYITGAPVAPSSYTAPTSNRIEVDGYIGPASVRALQHVLGSPYSDGMISRQNAIWKSHLKAVLAIEYTHQAGDTGSDIVRRMQAKCGANVDGLIGIDTIRRWQKLVGATTDGYFGQATARATQRWINERL